MQTNFVDFQNMMSFNYKPIHSPNLSESIQTLLIRERFVPVAAWEVIASRCSVDGCTNKAKGPGSVCAKHKADAASQSTALEHVAVKTAVSTLSQCTPAVFQPSSGSQCTPPGYQTQVSAYMSHNSSFISQVSLVPTQPHTETYTFAATRGGLRTLEISKAPKRRA